MSISEAKRLIKKGAVDVNGKKVLDWKYRVKSGDKIKIGRRTFLRVK